MSIIELNKYSLVTSTKVISVLLILLGLLSQSSCVQSSSPQLIKNLKQTLVEISTTDSRYTSSFTMQDQQISLNSMESGKIVLKQGIVTISIKQVQKANNANSNINSNNKDSNIYQICLLMQNYVNIYELDGTQICFQLDFQDIGLQADKDCIVYGDGSWACLKRPTQFRTFDKTRVMSDPQEIKIDYYMKIFSGQTSQPSMPNRISRYNLELQIAKSTPTWFILLSTTVSSSNKFNDSFSKNSITLLALLVLELYFSRALNQKLDKIYGYGTKISIVAGGACTLWGLWWVCELGARVWTVKDLWHWYVYTIFAGIFFVSFVRNLQILIKMLQQKHKNQVRPGSQASPVSYLATYFTVLLLCFYAYLYISQLSHTWLYQSLLLIIYPSLFILFPQILHNCQYEIQVLIDCHLFGWLGLKGLVMYWWKVLGWGGKTGWDWQFGVLVGLISLSMVILMLQHQMGPRFMLPARLKDFCWIHFQSKSKVKFNEYEVMQSYRNVADKSLREDEEIWD